MAAHLPRSRFLCPLPELASQELAGRGIGQLVEKLYRPRILVVGRLLRAVGAQLLLGYATSFLEGDEGL